MKPPEENIMNNLECNSSSLAIETSGVGLGVSGGLHQPDGPVIKSDKTIIDNKTLTNHKTSKTVIRVINGLVVSVTIMVTLLMRSSGRWFTQHLSHLFSRL